MRRIILTALSLIVPLAFTACTSGLPTDPVGEGSGTGGLNLSISISSTPARAAGLNRAPSSDFARGEVTLTKGAVTQTSPLTISGLKATVTIPQLAAGYWSLSVKFYNAANEVTYSTTTVSVSVQNGKTITVPLVMNPTGGTLTLDIDLPIDPDGTAFVGNFQGLQTADNLPIPNVTSCVAYWSVSNLIFQVNGVDNLVTVVDASNVIIPSWENLTAHLSADGSRVIFDNGTYWLRL